MLAPPHSSEAEKAVLGAVLRTPSQLNFITDKINLQAEHFYLDSHKQIYQAIIELDQNNHAIDIITITENLFRGHTEQKIFNPSYLIELIESCPVAQNIEYYASIVKEKHHLRQIISTCQDTIQQALKTEGNPGNFIEEVEKEFLKISSEIDSGEGLVKAKDILVPTLETLEERMGTSGPTGIKSGFFDLDNITGGWQKSDLIILAARPGMGKTALALNWALNASKESQSTTAIFTLEMSRTQLLERLLAAEGRLDSNRLRKGNLSEEDQDRLMTAARWMNNQGDKIVIDETPGISLGELRSRCRRYKKDHGLDLIVIDYLQLMSGTASAQKQGREREISEISMGLKGLAKELNIPIVACAQLNRGPDARPDKRPKISDLRESGSMEQDADQIIFIYRDDYYNPNSEFAGKAEILVAKNRHGETASIYLAWLPNFVAFHNLESRPEN